MLEETAIPKQLFSSTLCNLAQFWGTATLSDHEEDKEEKAVAASRRGGRTWDCICGSGEVFGTSSLIK